MVFLILLGLGLVWSQGSVADTSFASVSGASNSYVDSTTGRLQVFGGIVNPATGSTTTCTSTTSLCNTCDGSTSTWVACNKTAINPNLVFRIEVNETNAALLTAASTITLVNTTNSNAQVGGSITTGFTGSTYYATVNWSDLCAAGGSTSCGSSFTGTYELQLASGSTTETFQFQVTVSHVNADSGTAEATDNFFTPCDGATGTVGDGFCSWSAYPGDTKIYADNLALGGGSVYAGSASSIVKWNAVVFYYTENDQVDSATSLQKIRNSFPSKVITYDNTQTTPTVDGRITGLSNGVPYCLLIANRDQAGNIYKAAPVFASPAVYTTSAQFDAFCTTPEPVVGLLDDKRCFIATAAYGSPFEHHVRSLRIFRDQVLMQTAPGRAFVHLYYKVSPTLAGWIRQSDTARASVRVALWPVVTLAEFILSFGTSVLWFALLGLAAAGGFTVWVRRKRISA